MAVPLPMLNSLWMVPLGLAWGWRVPVTTARFSGSDGAGNFLNDSNFVCICEYSARRGKARMLLRLANEQRNSFFPIFGESKRLLQRVDFLSSV